MAALQASETHRIELAQGSRVVSTSDDLGWKNLHASVTSERRWAGALTPIDHICFAYCLRQSARIERIIAGEDSVRVLTLRPRQFGILPTRVASRFRLTGTADIMMIYLRGSLFERTAQEQYGMPASQIQIEPRVGFCDPLLEQVAVEIMAALDRQNATDDPPYVDQLATTAASHLLRHHGDHRGSASRPEAAARSSAALGGVLARARAYIEDNLDGDLSLTCLARLADLSPVALTNAFTAALGETPHRYIVKRRVERAKQLLVATNLSIAEVAFQTGFSSQSHMSDVFRRMTGETPHAYRRAADT